MADESLKIDFFDLEDIRRNLPAAKKRLDEMQTELSAKQREFEDWRMFVDFLARRANSVSHERQSSEIATVADAAVASAGQESTSNHEGAATGDGRPQPLDLVVEVVNREVRKIRAVEVANILLREGHKVTPMMVSNALFYAAKRAKPPRVKAGLGRGFYAPFAYRENLIGSSSYPSAAQASLAGNET